MKRIACISVALVLILATVVGCSEYVGHIDSVDTGESITPELMVEISKEMQQTEASPVDSLVTESSVAELVQTEATPAESSIMESVVNPVQTEATQIESSFAQPVPTDTTVPADEYIETTVPGTTTSDVIKETPIVPIETTRVSSTEAGGQSGDGQLVYWTPGGSVWHTTDKCISLSRSKEIINGSVTAAQSAGKDRVCKRCG